MTFAKEINQYYEIRIELSRLIKTFLINWNRRLDQSLHFGHDKIGVVLPT